MKLALVVLADVVRKIRYESVSHKSVCLVSNGNKLRRCRFYMEFNEFWGFSFIFEEMTQFFLNINNICTWLLTLRTAEMVKAAKLRCHTNWISSCIFLCRLRVIYHVSHSRLWSLINTVVLHLIFFTIESITNETTTSSSFVA